MRINHNIAALNTHRQLTSGTNAASKNMEKLSSGLRINRAGDDAAGLAISEKMRAQIRGLDMASRNAQDGISLIQTAEGALNETHSILQRMNELATQAVNDTNTDTDRAELQKEMDQLASEITRISTDTEFNTKKLIDGTAKDMTFQIGANEGQTISLSIGKMDAETLKVGTLFTADATGDNLTDAAGNTLTWKDGGDVAADGTGANLLDSDGNTIGTYNATGAKGEGFYNAGGDLVFAGSLNANEVAYTESAGYYDSTNLAKQSLAIDKLSDGDTVTKGIDITTKDAASKALTTVKSAVDSVSAERAKLGAVQNRLEHTINNLDTSSENLTAAESRIRDVDMAKEMMSYTKNNILTQASQAMLAQANQQPQGVLQLLR
ncbi:MULTISPECIES: flagellin N-terminal helical domain-containing protein [unclassified Bacillus (in: firmicutes)]|uniref:flagellin N-terminal helical domain-containing protein n=1 Tax=unclassified Bacillus (in: firmicutes) TaxID=185979 RepID=UPI00041AC3F0|nr:flagellin [Bacillus sp. NSP9.1]QHZ45431.1 flagellin [Bacillus sp. NSP9.1]